MANVERWGDDRLLNIKDSVDTCLEAMYINEGGDNLLAKEDMQYLLGTVKQLTAENKRLREALEKVKEQASTASKYECVTNWEVAIHQCNKIAEQALNKGERR